MSQEARACARATRPNISNQICACVGAIALPEFSTILAIAGRKVEQPIQLGEVKWH